MGAQSKCAAAVLSVYDPLICFLNSFGHVFVEGVFGLTSICHHFRYQFAIANVLFWQMLKINTTATESCFGYSMTDGATTPIVQFE